MSHHVSDQEKRHRPILLRGSLWAAVLAAAAIGASTGSPGAAASSSALDPAGFTTTIDNPFLPLVPGTLMRYRETGDDGEGAVVVRVTHRTKSIQGVETVVVRDRAYLDGELVEDTFDWYAQDRRGNVWYFGENTKEYENGRVVSTAGSWKAGRDGARAGIVMKAQPRAGDTYYQEYSPGVAEDQATVLSLEASATVPYGSFCDVLKTKDFTALEPGIVERKFYARGVGPVLEKLVSGGNERLVLVKVMHS
ncbi:MAG: hypothetical protein H0U35_01440 [Sporichthyaceae bacterium]|nr:hypothetical protein [Sporichthyaceae bacterium]